MVHHARLGRKIRMTRPHRLFGRDRETIDEAYPGDVVGLVNPGLFTIGDTLTSDPTVTFDPIPHFPPECFGLLRTQDISKHKQFQRDSSSWKKRGHADFLLPDHVRREPVLAAVGELQFDVVMSRLEHEYGVKTTVERMPHTMARWIVGDPAAISAVYWPSDTVRLVDQQGRGVMLFTTEHLLAYCIKSNPPSSFCFVKRSPAWTADNHTPSARPLRPRQQHHRTHRSMAGRPPHVEAPTVRPRPIPRTAAHVSGVSCVRRDTRSSMSLTSSRWLTRPFVSAPTAGSSAIRADLLLTTA